VVCGVCVWVCLERVFGACVFGVWGVYLVRVYLREFWRAFERFGVQVVVIDVDVDVDVVVLCVCVFVWRGGGRMCLGGKEG